jgi:ADP-ribose pyrophosphatase YjhB (NUDIX family)
LRLPDVERKSQKALESLQNSISKGTSRLFLGLARWRRGMTLGVRAAVFDDDERIFLVRHSYVPGWYLPGGGVEPGETLAEALDRELIKEGGIALDEPAELFGLYLNRRLSRRDHVALFISRAWRQDKPPRLPNLEIVDCGFFAADALPEAVSAATRRRLAEIRREVAVSPEW